MTHNSPEADAAQADAAPALGRPPKYAPDFHVLLHVRRSRLPSRLQSTSDRRAIIQFLVDSGGHSTLGAVDEHFEQDMRQKVMALASVGWLDVLPPLEEERPLLATGLADALEERLKARRETEGDQPPATEAAS